MTMMRKDIKIRLLVLFLALCAGINAQQQDFQTRLGVDVSGDLLHDFGWDIETQQRWRNNSSVSDLTLFQAGASYTPFSFLEIGLGYRGSFVYQQNETTAYKQRIHTDVSLDHRINPFKLVYRNRLQYGFDRFQTFSLIGGPALTWRHRIGVKYYPFGWPLRPQASVEIFQKLNTSDKRGISEIRYIIGTEYLLSRQLSLDVDYILNKEINDSNPITENIISASLNYKF